MLPFDAVRYSALQCVAACCSMLQHGAACCSMLHHVPPHVTCGGKHTLTPNSFDFLMRFGPQCVAVYCSMLQCVTVCSTMFCHGTHMLAKTHRMPYNAGLFRKQSLKSDVNRRAHLQNLSVYSEFQVYRVVAFEFCLLSMKHPLLRQTKFLQQ